MSGNNSWAGNITLGTNSLIQSLLGQLTLSGTLGNGGNGADFIFAGLGDTLISGAITNNADVIKNGTGTLTLAGANTYTGTTIVNAGTLRLTGSLNGTTGTALTFGGDGTFNFNEAAGRAQGMGLLSFGSGDGNVQSTYGGSGNTSLTFSSFAAMPAGATGNFIVSGGTNGTTNKIVVSGLPVGVINSATFFNGDNYAYVDPAGFIRGINYGVDPGTAVSPGGTTLSGDHVKANGHITSQGTQRFETLHIASNINYTIGTNQKVTVNGILKTGNVAGGAIISGGDYLKPDPDVNMTIRTARENDFLTIQTPIIANGTNAVTKTGLGTLTLSGVNTYTGGTYVTDGTLQIGASERLLSSGALTVAGGTFNLQNFTETVGPVVLTSGAINGDGAGTLIGSSYDVRSGSASAILAGNAALTKSTDGTVTLTGANTYSGTTTVSGGTLVAAAPSGGALAGTSAITIDANGNLALGASNQINDAAPVTLAGGTLSKGDFSEGTSSAVGAGTLSLTVDGSHIDFGTGTPGTLAFAIFNPGSYSLLIDNWTGTPGSIGDATTDRLIFATNPTPNLSSFIFTGYNSGAVAWLLDTGYYEVTPGSLTPVPEMNPALAASTVCAALAVLFHRRFVRAQRRQS
jgi:autotransporter-associated beta strand protein